MKKILSALFALLLLVNLAAPTVFASEKNVRVGVFPLGQFQGFDENGEACGYNVDYLNRIAQITHRNYEYVEVTNWVEATDLLERGEIDLLAPAQKTEALSEVFDYTVCSMGTEFGAIYTLAERSDLLYEDFSAMAGLKYGGAKNSTFTAKFLEQYSVDEGFTPDITLYATTTELFNALYGGQVDAVVTNIMFAGDDLKLLGRFFPMPVYYITAKNNSALLAELDDAMIDIRMADPAFETKLMSRYFPMYSNTQFTYEETQFIESMPVITIGYQVNHAPLSYTDETTGEFAGITRDILDKLAQKSGLTFQYVALPATNVTYEYLQENEIYVLSSVEYNSVNTGKSAMQLSSPYLESAKVLVSRQDMTLEADSSLRVALATGSGTLAQVIAEAYPYFEVVVFATVEECFDAVKNGTCDATMQNRHVAEVQLTNPDYGDLRVLPIQSLSDQLCLSTIAFPSDFGEYAQQINNGTFISIVDKTIKQLSALEVDTIIMEATAACRYQTTFLDFLYEYRYSLSCVTLLVVVCLLLLVHSRTVEKVKNQELGLKNDQLAEAVNQAERANTAKSQFLSRMSHEIRTPMNAIVGITAIAKMHLGEEEKTQEYLEKIDTSSKILLNIINDVLDMSAIESEKLKIAHVPFDLKTLLQGVSSMYYAQCKQKGIQFDLQLRDVTEEFLVGDCLRVNQILLNLLSNAYKFTPEGGSIKIVVTQMSRKESTVFLRFEVADTGCGISQEMQQRIFMPFEQESAQTAQSHGGSGLGLSITKNLVEMMHGAIRLESRKSAGTTFTVDLPFEVDHRSEEYQQANFRDIRALIVDDDESTIEYTSIVLERIGVQFDIASSGEQAIQIMTEEYNRGTGYDVCFVDWKMPSMSGVEVTKKIRALFDADTIIIIVSAYDLSEVEGEAKAAGADMFISKPLFQSAVCNVLMTLSGGKFTKLTADKNEYDFTGKRVLLAEDNAPNREIAVELLEMVNFTVECAENGKEAFDLFEASAPGYYDAILMDIQMPILDGYETTKKIRSSDHADAARIAIFAMTANAFAEDISAALSSGMNGHIAKPIDTEVLYQTLKAYWQEKN